MVVMPLQLCDSAWSEFVWVDDSALFEKRDASVEYPASASSDAAASLKRECETFASAAEDAAPKSISTLKHNLSTSTLFLCEDNLRSCKKGGVAHEQGRVADLSAARAKAAEEKAAAEAAAKEAARQRELESANAAVTAESLVPYLDKYSVHSGLSSSYFTALGMPDSDAEKLALMVTKDLQAKAEAKAAEEAKAAAEMKAAEEAAAAQSIVSSGPQDSASSSDSSTAPDEKTGVAGGILDSISSFFSEPAAPSAADL